MSWRTGDAPERSRDQASKLVRELDPYIRLLRGDVFRADKLLMAVATTANACNKPRTNHGPYVDTIHLRSLLAMLCWSYGLTGFGGIAGWEYRQARSSSAGRDVGGSRLLWLWAKKTRAILEKVFVGG